MRTRETIAGATGTPLHWRDVVADIRGALRGFGWEVASSSETGTTLTLDREDFLVLSDATAGNVTVNLPQAALNPGKTYYIKKIDVTANTVTITPFAGDTVDGAASVALAVYGDCRQIMNDGGTGWWIV
jgi:hypothetical protein